jgi:molybdate transport system permease protein
MPADLWDVTGLTLAAAIAATAVMLPPGIALAWLLARREFAGKTIVDTLASLPLVMPPVATGLILLYIVGRRSPIGAALASAGIDIVFTRKAVVLAMAVMGFPLLVRTARAGFELVPSRFEQIAATLGARPWRVFTTITLPLASRTVLAGALLAFSRAVGEFGATVLVAGSIPGRTRTIALAIFSETETGHDSQAALFCGVAIAIAFAAVAASNALTRRARVNGA